jgi:PAS domain-containing protein
MIDWQVVYVLGILFAVLALAVLSAYAWRFRYAELGPPFLLMTLSGLCWSAMVLLQAVLPPEVARLLLNIRHLFAALSPIALLWYVLMFTGQIRVSSGKFLAALSIIPIAGLLMLFGEGNSGWMLRDISFVRDGILTSAEHIAFGPFYWVFLAQAYLLTALSFAALLANSYRATPLMRGQILTVAVGIAAPVIANLLLLTQIVPRKFDPMPYGIVFMAGMIWWAHLRYKLFDLIPLARNVMVDAMLDCVLAVDAKGRIIDVNRAMSDLLKLPVALTLGRPLSDLGFEGGAESVATTPDRETLLALLSQIDAPVHRSTLTLGQRQFAPRVVPLPTRGNGSAGQLLVLHDVTERLRVEAEREASLAALKEALAQVKTLRGLLPICASCKMISNKVGNWQPIEEYIRENSEADLSHGVCPGCQARLYSDYLTPGSQGDLEQGKMHDGVSSDRRR